MQDSIRLKLSEIRKRHQELEAVLANPEGLDHKMFEKVGKELHAVAGIVQTYNHYEKLEQELLEAKELANDDDMKDLVVDEIQALEAQMQEDERSLMVLLLPKDPDDDKDIYIEIRAGAGGDEQLVCRQVENVSHVC